LAAAEEPTYWKDVRPILRKHCTVCHSAKNLKEPDVSGGLAVDSYESLLKGSSHGVIRPAKSADSLLVQLLLTDDDEKRMPRGAAPLSAEKIDLIRRWIDSGAKEGQKPAGSSQSPVATTPRHTRKRDVLLTTNVVPPAGLLGRAKLGKLDLVLKLGPLSPVTAVAFSPDGRLLALGSYRQVTIWDLTTVRPVKTLSNILAAVNDLRFSPDGRLLAVAGGQPSAKGDLRLYEVADWKLLAALGGHDDVVFSVAFDASGRRLASASFDKTVRVWDVAAHKVERTFTGHSDFVYSVAFSPDGQWLASASKDRSVKVIDTATGKSRFTLSGMDQDVLAVAIRPDGKSLVSSGFESALYWWNPQTGERVRLQAGHGVAVHELCFSKDGAFLASAGADQTVRLWNGANGAPLRTMPVGSIAYAVALSPDARLVAAGSFDGLVRLWETASGRLLLTLLAVAGDGDQADWIGVTPEGYMGGSAGALAQARWQVAGQTVATRPIWKALAQPLMLARALQGKKLAAPQFVK
jgi:WD40 repeat protein